MQKVDRAKYIPATLRAYAYEDSPKQIGYNANISAPHMHAHVSELLLPYLDSSSSVLDVGSGSGYLLSVFYHLTGGSHKGKHIVGIEHIQELVDVSQKNMLHDGLEPAILNRDIIVRAGDGRFGKVVSEHTNNRGT